MSEQGESNHTIGNGLEVEWHDGQVIIIEPDRDVSIARIRVKMKPSTALNLLVWLLDEVATLVRLAEEKEKA